MSLKAIENGLHQATLDGELCGVVVGAASADGSFNYMKAFGRTALDPSSAPISPDTPLSLASSSKLITNVAVLQCVERGLVALDTPVASIFPEWTSPQILTGFDDSSGKPILTPAKQPITLAQLVTHTSGIASFDSETLIKYYRSIGDHAGPDLIAKYFSPASDFATRTALLPDLFALWDHVSANEPLFFEPGTDWEYGNGTHWAGLVVERVSGLPLDAYCQQHIFAPLGIAASFQYDARPDLAAAMIPMLMRQPDGRIAETPRIWPGKSASALGGAGAVCSAASFMRLLTALLRRDGVLLSAESTNLLFGWRLPDNAIVNNPERRKEHFDEWPADVRLDHSLAGLVNLDEHPQTGRGRNSSTWAGASGTFWWVDGEKGVCGFWGGQLMLVRDGGRMRAWLERFERAVHEELESRKQ